MMSKKKKKKMNRKPLAGFGSGFDQPNGHQNGVQGYAPQGNGYDNQPVPGYGVPSMVPNQPGMGMVVGYGQKPPSRSWMPALIMTAEVFYGLTLLLGEGISRYDELMNLMRSRGN